MKRPLTVLLFLCILFNVRSEMANLHFVTSERTFLRSAGTMTADTVPLDACTIDSVAYSKDTTQLIKCPTSKVGIVVIPTSVKYIQPFAFQNCINLTSVILPSGLDSIGEAAFNGCNGLTDIKLPAGITTIGGDAFLDCVGLKKATTPYANYLKQVHDGYVVTSLFEGCTNLDTVYIPEGIKDIRYIAFASIQNFSTVILPSSVETIGDFAFALNMSLRALTLPASVSKINSSSFAGCFANLTVEPGNKWFVVEDSALYNVSKTHLMNCQAFKISGFRIPSTVTCIDSFAFFYCFGLESITIPSSVSEIQPGAFNECWSLQSLTIQSVVPPVIADTFFQESFIQKDQCSLFVPQQSILEYRLAPGWRYFTTIQADTTGVALRKLQKDIDLMLYPNPVNDYFHIAGLKQQALLKVYDLNGILQFEQRIQEDVINTSCLKAGSYVIEIITESGTALRRFQKN